MNPNENKNMCDSCGKECSCCAGCGCGHHYVAPIALILIGVAFLLQAFTIMSAYVVSIAWPILLIVAASTKFCRCCKKC